jgi:hypothetical protein
LIEMRALLHPGYLPNRTSRQKQAVEDETPLPVSLAVEVDVDALPTFVSESQGGG